MIAAISPFFGLVFHRLLDTTLSISSFEEVVVDLLDAFEAYNGTRFVLVLANLAAHSESALFTLFTDTPHVVLFLPRYSPQLNPIELSFNDLKREVKTQLATRRGQLNDTDTLPWGQKTVTRRQILREAIGASLGTIAVPKCAAWYAHSNGYYLPCLQGLNLQQ